MAKSTITLADEAADALLVKPKQSKSSNTKGILALGLLAFALGLLATPSLRQALVGLTGDQWSLASFPYSIWPCTFGIPARRGPSWAAPALALGGSFCVRPGSEGLRPRVAVAPVASLASVFGILAAAVYS